MSLLSAVTVLWVLLVIVAYTIFIAALSYVLGYKHAAVKGFNFVSTELQVLSKDKITEFGQFLSQCVLTATRK